MGATVRIGSRLVGKGQPCYIVAEMSANHGGDYEQAVRILRAAKEFGADAVKLQTYRADTITLNCDGDDFRISSESPWADSKTLFSLYEKAYTPWEWHRGLFQEARSIGLDIFSSPFDATAVDLLESLDACAYKVASPEITDIPLLERIAATGKPVILSTGVADLSDLTLAVDTLRGGGANEIVLLKCTTAYPAPAEEANLRTIPDMATRFNCVAGLSDHTLGLGVPIAAVALGASFLEKHYILEHGDNSEDAFFSLNTLEFKTLVAEVRKVEKALGRVCYDLTSSSRKSVQGRRSLYVAKDVKRGDILTRDDIRSVRPGLGLHPKHLGEFLGRRAGRDLSLGERANLDMIEE